MHDTRGRFARLLPATWCFTTFSVIWHCFVQEIALSMCFCRGSSSVTRHTLFAYSFSAWMRDMFELPMISKSTWDGSVVGVLGFPWWLTVVAGSCFYLGDVFCHSPLSDAFWVFCCNRKAIISPDFFCHFNFAFFSRIFVSQQQCFMIVQMICCVLVMFTLFDELWLLLCKLPFKVANIFSIFLALGNLNGKILSCVCVSICLSSLSQNVDLLAFTVLVTRDILEFGLELYEMKHFLVEANSLFRSLLSRTHLL